MPLNLMERVMFLRSAPLCAGMPAAALRVIAEVAHERSFGPGEVLFLEEDLGTEMFLVIEGAVEVRKLGRRPPERAGIDELGALLAIVSPGDVVGEMSVLDDRPRSASVVSDSNVTVLSIHKEDLRDAIALCPDLAFGLFRVLSERLRAMSAGTPQAPGAAPSGPRGDRPDRAAPEDSPEADRDRQ